MHPAKLRVMAQLSNSQFEELMQNLPKALMANERAQKAGVHNVVLGKWKKGTYSFDFSIGTNGNRLKIETAITRDHDCLRVEVMDPNGQVRKRFQMPPINKTVENEMGAWLEPIFIIATATKEATKPATTEGRNEVHQPTEQALA